MFSKWYIWEAGFLAAVRGFVKGVMCIWSHQLLSDIPDSTLLNVITWFFLSRSVGHLYDLLYLNNFRFQASAQIREISRGLRMNLLSELRDGVRTISPDGTIPCEEISLSMGTALLTLQLHPFISRLPTCCIFIQRKYEVVNLVM